MNIFSYESKFYEVIKTLIDVIMLSIITVIISLLSCGLLYGTSITAMYYSIYENIIEKKGNILKKYWISFKKNFKQSIIIWLIIGGLMGIICFNLYYMHNYQINNTLAINTIHFFALSIFLFISVIIFPFIARYDLTLKKYLINSFIYAYKNLWITITCVSANVLLVALVIKTNLLILIIGLGINIYLQCRLVRI